MYRILFFASALALALSSNALADPWKDESGHGKWIGGWGEFNREWKSESRGETPWWARGKGYWDGHFKHRRGGPPPWAGRPERYYDDPRQFPGSLYYPAGACNSDTTCRRPVTMCHHHHQPISITTLDGGVELRLLMPFL